MATVLDPVIARPETAPAPVPDALGRWLFAERPLVGLAVLRIAIGLALLMHLGGRWFYVHELYSTEALVLPYGIVYELGLPHLSYPMALGLFSTLMLCVFAIILGFWTNLALWAAAVLQLYFMSCTSLFVCAVDSIAFLTLVFLAMSRCGDALSVDRFLAVTGEAWPTSDMQLNPSDLWSARGAIWPQRAVALQISFIYLCATAMKLGHSGWGYLTGVELAGGLQRWQFATAASIWIAHHWWMAMLMSSAGTFGELFLAVGLNVRRLRPYALAFGIGMHLTILITLRIPHGLSLIMIASYAAFVEPETWQRWLNRWFASARRGRRALVLDQNRRAL